MKKIKFICFIFVAIAASAFADPKEDDIKLWLNEKEALLEKRWYWADKTTILKSYAITDIKIIKCEEKYKLKPWEQNLGTAWVSFIYRESGSLYKFEAVFQYTFDGVVLRERKAESIMIVRK